MLDEKRLVKISRYLSKHLRHRPERLGLELEPGAWEEAIFYDHPSGRTRIETAMTWKKEHMHDPDIRMMDGPVGQASALKMSYAGLTKGLHAVGVAVIRGAIEAGVNEAFLAELAESQPELLAYFTRRTPGIFAKAYRWVAEMQEIGDFLGGEGEAIYDGAAELFDRMAKDHAGSKVEEAQLRAFLSNRLR